MILYWKCKEHDVYFFCGSTPPEQINGPGWDDVPYEEFAQMPDAQFIEQEYVFHFRDHVVLLEPKDWNKNIDSPFSMRHIVDKHIPFLIVVPVDIIEEREEQYTDDDQIDRPLYSEWDRSDDPRVCKLYLGDNLPFTYAQLMDYVDELHKKE